MNFQLKSIIVSTLFIGTFIMSIAGAICISHRETRETRDILKDLYQIEQNVKIANQALREAALAPTDELIEKELSILPVTKASSTRIYSGLPNKPLKESDKQIIATLILERPDYRIAQLNVVQAIRSHNKQVTWDMLHVYKVYQEIYTKHVDDLINSSETNLVIIKDKLIKRLIIIVGIFILLQSLDKLYYVIKWKKYNDQVN